MARVQKIIGSKLGVSKLTIRVAFGISNLPLWGSVNHTSNFLLLPPLLPLLPFSYCYNIEHYIATTTTTLLLSTNLLKR